MWYLQKSYQLKLLSNQKVNSEPCGNLAGFTRSHTQGGAYLNLLKLHSNPPRLKHIETKLRPEIKFNIILNSSSSNEYEIYK